MWVAALGTTLLWRVATLLFRWYVQNFGSYNKTYGTIGGVIVLLTWMYYSMIVVLVGGELAAELMKGTGGVRSRAGHLYDGRISTGGPTDAPSVEVVDRAPSKPGRSRGDRPERPVPAGGVEAGAGGAAGTSLPWSLPVLGVVLAVLAGLEPSNGAAKKLIQNRGLKVDGETLTDPQATLELPAEGVVLQKGKDKFVRLVPQG